MIINRSDKYNEKGEFWHKGRRVNIVRSWGGIGMHGLPKFVVVVGEEMFGGQSHYYIMVEAECEKGESLADAFSMARRFTAEYRVERWWGRMDTNVDEVLAITNRGFYNKGLNNLVINDTPRLGEWIDEGLSLVQQLAKPRDKRLHFFGKSMIPAELKSCLFNKNRADDYPRATALTAVIGAIMKHGYERVTEAELMPEPEGVF